MGEGDDEKGDLPKLRKREDFHGWKEKMLLYSMEKGDTDGIFSDTGNDPTIGYQALPAGAVGNQRRLEWARLSNKLTGRVGLQIVNATLSSTWNNTMATCAAAGNRVYQFALCMEAVEKNCGGVEETAKQIARSRFKVALGSFIEKNGKDGNAGFEEYADEVRKAEEKLSQAGVVMGDDEKKEKFYSGFNPRSSKWQSCKTFWEQSPALTFDDILSRGVQQQQQHDATQAESEASGVRSFAAMQGSDAEDEEHEYKKRRDSKGRGRGTSAYYSNNGKGGKGKGGKGKFPVRGRSKGGGRGNGHNPAGRGGGKGTTNTFQGECFNCGKIGHKAADCWSVSKGGKGGKGKGGKDKRDFFVPGCVAMPDIGSSGYGDMIEYALFGLFIYLFYSIIMSLTDTTSYVLAFVAPITRYGMAKVKNGLTDSDPRFHISFNSAIGEVKGKFSRVIFDTGAAMHVLNTSKFMANTSNDNSYKVYGVGGKEKAVWFLVERS